MASKFWHISKRCLSTSLTRLARVTETRGAYATLDDKDVATFERLLGTQGVATDPHELNAYNADWLNTCQGDVSDIAVMLFSVKCETSKGRIIAFGHIAVSCRLRHENTFLLKCR